MTFLSGSLMGFSRWFMLYGDHAKIVEPTELNGYGSPQDRRKYFKKIRRISQIAADIGLSQVGCFFEF